MKNILVRVLSLTAFLSSTVLAVLLLLTSCSLDASAVSVPSMPEGTEFVDFYPKANDSLATVVDTGSTTNNSRALLVPVLPNRGYIFRFFNPPDVSYYDRFRVGAYHTYPIIGTTGRYLAQYTSDLVRDGDYLTFSFTTESSDNYILILLWGLYANHPDLPERYLGYISPELYYDADIHVSAFPERFYPGDDMLLVAANATEENTFFSVGFRSVGDVEVISIGTFGGDSYGFNWTWSVPYSMESGSYEFIIRAQTPYQTVSVSVPFVVLYSPAPDIPTETPPVNPDISSLPEASDFVINIPDEFVEITVYVFGDLIPVELIPMLAMTMVCLFLGVIVRGDKSQ